ncbi:hypothetical protein GIB67_001214 [Kingdonia uniflora]|uniref:KIB1-4 beta-propeller domain-containing protein n=1 Tax=Kingdonia uniflora TaxID=39325 RepID=A0A7J7LGF1_9MAGN|nr:hypothetical protein GIB67_001214 [Kingdonia uniflora]
MKGIDLSTLKRSKRLRGDIFEARNCGTNHNIEICRLKHNNKNKNKASYVISKRECSQLPEDLIGNIAKWVSCIDDIVRFGVEARGKKYLGSSFGWLFTIGLDIEIHLLNPITRVQIRLPPQSFPKQWEHFYYLAHLCQMSVSKVVLSTGPSVSTTNCIAMTIYSCDRLGFASPEAGELYMVVKMYGYVKEGRLGSQIYHTKSFDVYKSNLDTRK